MKRKANLDRVEMWRQRLERQAAGPWSVAEFCRREDISQPSFYQWRKRLGGKLPGPRGRGADDGVENLEFVAVELPESLAASGIRIDLPGGAVVRLPASATAEMIAAAVQAAYGSRTAQEVKTCSA